MTADERRRFQQGDPAIFRVLVEAESPRLLAYATSLTGDPEEAGELVQASWVHAFEHRTEFQERGPLLAWLLAICRSRHLSGRRAHTRRSAALAGAAAASDGRLAPAAEGEAARAELRARLADALARLPERQRAVVVSRLLEGASTRAVARQLGVAEGTVKATLHAALQNLRPELESCR